MSKNQTISGALKALFLELGGDSTKLADNSKISDYIDDLASVLEPKAPELFVVTYSYNETSEANELDKTWAEIAEAYAQGKTIALDATGFYFATDTVTLSPIASLIPTGIKTGEDGVLTQLDFSGIVYGSGDSYYLTLFELNANGADALIKQEF